MSRRLNEEFIAKYKNSFSEAVLSKVFASKASLTGKELLQVTPSKQLNFLVMKILFKEWQSEMKRLESPYFNYRSQEVRQAMVQFMNTLSQNIEVNRDTLMTLLGQALSECFLLITGPSEFVKQEFPDRDSVPYSSKHAKSLLKYIKVLTDEFEDFFNAQASGTYAEVFEIADDYFADVDLTPAQEQVLADLGAIQPLTLEDLLSEEELVDVIDFGEDFEEDQPEESAPVAAPQPEAPEEKEELEIPISAKEDLPVDEEKVEEPTDEEAAETETPEDEVTEQEEPQDEVETASTVNDQFAEEEDRSVAKHLEEAEDVKGMLSAISVNQQYMFAQELFEGDANAFQKAISEIDGFNTFDDAVEHLVSNYAKNYDWDMNSDQVKELLKVIFRRFR